MRKILIIFLKKWIGLTGDFHMIPDRDIRDSVKSVTNNSLFAQHIICEVHNSKVSPVNPPAVFVSMLVLSLSFDFPVNESP